MEIKRAGCFEGGGADSNAVCVKVNCDKADDCIWKKLPSEIGNNLGTMPEGRGKMLIKLMVSV